MQATNFLLLSTSLRIRFY